MNPVHFSSASVEHATPQDFFDKLNSEFGFTLDVCATPENAKCAKFYTEEQNGLYLPWHADTWWGNFPYGRGLGAWCAAAVNAQNLGATGVALLPARTDTKWFQDYVLPCAELRWVRGRLKFGNAKNAAPFPSVVAVYRGRR